MQVRVLVLIILRVHGLILFQQDNVGIVPNVCHLLSVPRKACFPMKVISKPFGGLRSYLNVDHKLSNFKE